MGTTLSLTVGPGPAMKIVKCSFQWKKYVINFWWLKSSASTL